MKVQIWYSIDCYADEFKRNESRCEAMLHFNRNINNLPSESETLVARGATFAEARE